MDIDTFEDPNSICLSDDNMNENSSQCNSTLHQFGKEPITVINDFGGVNDDDIDYDDFYDDDDDDDDDNDIEIDDNDSDTDNSIVSASSVSESIEMKNKLNKSYSNEIFKQKMTDSDDDSIVSATSVSESIEIENKLNKSNSNKILKQKMTYSGITELFSAIGKPDKHTLTRKYKVSTSKINSSKNENLSGSNIYSSVLLSNNKKKPPLSVLSSESFVNPTTTIPKLQSKSSTTTKNNENENGFKQKQIFQTISSIDPKSGVYVVRDNKIRKSIEESKSHSLSYNFSSLSKVNTIDNGSKTSKYFQDNQPKTAPKFIARMQKLPDGKYKMIPSQGKVPINLEKLFKRNSHFIKHKMPPGSTKFHTSSNTKHIQLGSRVSFGKSSKPNYFVGGGKNFKLVPHTVTSKDAIDNLKNNIANNEAQTKISNQGKLIPSSLVLSKSQSFIQPDDQSFNVTRYDKTTKHFNNTIQVSINEKDKHLLRKSIIDSNDLSCSINNNSTDAKKYNKVTKLSYASKDMLGEIIKDMQEFTDEDDDQSGRFVSCQYEYCHTLVYEPELIDGLYCSFTCKHLQEKQIRVVDESDIDVEDNTNTHKKFEVDQKNCLSKLENEINIKIHKRKQLFTTPCLEKMIKINDQNDVQHHTDDMCNEVSLDGNESSESISDQTQTPEVEDDEEMIFDLKSLISDEKILNYMEEMQFRAAPNNLFDKPFPTRKNLFKIGQKLEGIDPEHEALFCVLTVVRVRGYRIKLHFDGYSDNYNFWANADSPNLFYAGWCEENSRILQPPKNYDGNFDWVSYLKASNAYPAPKQNFASTKMIANCKPHLFRVGDKLETLDVLTRTLPKQIVCVGTVADIIGDRIRIHYDGWTDDYDCWMDMTSTNIHPVGWCKNNGRCLARPSGYNDHKGKKPFSWTHYLKETKSKPVPQEAFVPRPLRDFSINTTIEVVDIACPSLIRAAEIIDVRGDELKILYDGFAVKYAYWVEDDSPDIHPIGWSIKTNHPIEIPSAQNKLAGCKIQGCNGKGNITCLNAYNHLLFKDCPYEFDSWENSITGLAKKLDRLKSVEILKRPSDMCSTSETIEQIEENNLNLTTCDNLTNHKEKIIEDRLSIKQHSSLNDRRNAQRYNTKLCNDICLSFGFRTLGRSWMSKQSKIWTRHNSQLGLPMYNTTDARNWTCLEVATYVDQVVTNNYSHQNLQGNSDVSQRFLDQEIDGDVFLMLTQKEIMNNMKIPFGHALKIYSAITMLRQRVPVFDWFKASTTYFNN